MIQNESGFSYFSARKINTNPELLGSARESFQHLQFCREKCRIFEGRETELKVGLSSIMYLLN